MTEKLNGAELRFREIEAALSDGEVVSDIERYTKLMKEYRAPVSYTHLTLPTT